MTELKKVTSGRQKSGLLKPDQRQYLRRLFTVFILGALGMGTFGINGVGNNDNNLTDADYERVNKNLARMQEKENRKAERQREESDKQSEDSNWDRFLDTFRDLFGGERS